MLTTRQEEGEALGAAAGTELELLLHTGQFLTHHCLPAWLPWPEIMAEASISWKAVGSITSPSAVSSRAAWAALNTFTGVYRMRSPLSPCSPGGEQHQSLVTQPRCQEAAAREGGGISDCFPSAIIGQKLVSRFKSYEEAGKSTSVRAILLHNKNIHLGKKLWLANLLTPCWEGGCSSKEFPRHRVISSDNVVEKTTVFFPH